MFSLPAIYHMDISYHTATTMNTEEKEPMSAICGRLNDCAIKDNDEESFVLVMPKNMTANTMLLPRKDSKELGESSFRNLSKSSQYLSLKATPDQGTQSSPRRFILRLRESSHNNPFRSNDEGDEPRPTLIVHPESPMHRQPMVIDAIPTPFTPTENVQSSEVPLKPPPCRPRRNTSFSENVPPSALLPDL